MDGLQRLTLCGLHKSSSQDGPHLTAVVPDWGIWEGLRSAGSRGCLRSSLELAFFLCLALLPSPPSRTLSPRAPLVTVLRDRFPAPGAQPAALSPKNTCAHFL